MSTLIATVIFIAFLFILFSYRKVVVAIKKQVIVDVSGKIVRRVNTMCVVLALIYIVALFPSAIGSAAGTLLATSSQSP